MYGQPVAARLIGRRRSRVAGGNAIAQPGQLVAQHFDFLELAGEIVVVVAPPSQEETAQDDLDAQLLAALEQASLRDAAAMVATATGLPKRQVYARALALSRRDGP